MKLWTESESLTSDMAAVSFESLRSMCSDREQVFCFTLIFAEEFCTRCHELSC